MMEESQIINQRSLRDTRVSECVCVSSAFEPVDRLSRNMVYPGTYCVEAELAPPNIGSRNYVW